MLLMDLFEVTTWFSFWLNVNTGEIIDVDGEHSAYVRKHPQKFGITVEEILRLGNWFKVLETIAKNGWVRGGKESRAELYLQGYSNQHLLKAANRIAKDSYFAVLRIDTFFETFHSSSFIRLEGKELERWLKTGKFTPSSRSTFESLI